MIICISGLTSAGKSLVAETLKRSIEAEGQKVVHFNSDMIAKRVLAHKYDFTNHDFDYSSEDLTTIYQTMYTLFSEILGLNPDTVILTDGMYRRASQRIVLELIAKRLNVEFKLIYIDTKSSIAKNRTTNRFKNGGHGGWVDPIEYEYYFPNEVIKIDNNKSVAKLLSEIENLVNILM